MPCRSLLERRRVRAPFFTLPDSKYPVCAVRSHHLVNKSKNNCHNLSTTRIFNCLNWREERKRLHAISKAFPGSLMQDSLEENALKQDWLHLHTIHLLHSQWSHLGKHRYILACCCFQHFTLWFRIQDVTSFLLFIQWYLHVMCRCWDVEWLGWPFGYE